MLFTPVPGIFHVIRQSRSEAPLRRCILSGGKKLLSVSERLDREYLAVCDSPDQLMLHGVSFDVSQLDEARAWAGRFGVEL